MMQLARPPSEVAYAGNEADDAVEAEADLGAGDAEPGVEHAGEHVEVFVAKGAACAAHARTCAGGGSRGQDLGIYRLGGHARALLRFLLVGCYNQDGYGGYSSVAERRSVAADVVGSNPTSRPNLPFPVHRNQRAVQAARNERLPLPRAPKVIPTAASALALSPQNLFVGTSGWAYPSWKPGFYPAMCRRVPSCSYYASKLTSVEVNYTFRTLPTAAQLQGWLGCTRQGFKFSFKAPQRITHFQRLRESDEAVG